jgi:hypothetical protein
MNVKRIIAALFAGAAFTVAAGLAQEFDLDSTSTTPEVSVTAADEVPTLLGPDMKKTMGNSLGPDNTQPKH